MYAEHFTLQPFLLTITFALDPARPIASSVIPDVPILIPIQSVVDMIGNMLGNIDSAQVRLSAFLAKDLLMGKEELFSRLSSHYVRQILRKFYKVVGSAALLGNPVGLFESVGSGVKAFFYEPIQGLSKGPEEFIDGLGRGAKTFLLNTTYGIANSASKITGTIGNGLSAIAGTETYRLDRAAGKSGIIYGVREGVLGMFKDSVNGAKENGVMGAITGTGRGIVGLITKPVTGVLDDTTKIIESVKDATHVSREMHRKRLPRREDRRAHEDCRLREMRRPVEIEFAANLSREKDKTGTFYLLQIRPIVDTKEVLDEDLDTLPDRDLLLRSNNSLGHGIMDSISDVVYIKTQGYTASNNPAIAREIERLNQQMLDMGRHYILIGPGRWGSSDPWLGIPVKWPHISGARVIVEAGLTNYRVDPSQGTHFFQNLTSFGVGYFTINAYMGDGLYNQAYLDALPAVHESELLRHVRAPRPFVVKMDGKRKKGVVLLPG